MACLLSRFLTTFLENGLFQTDSINATDQVPICINMPPYITIASVARKLKEAYVLYSLALVFFLSCGILHEA